MEGLKTASAPVDWEEGLARAGDDEDFFKELLELFLDDVPQRMENLSASLSAGQLDESAGVAHSIKGASANLSARTIHQVAAQLEQAAKQGQPPEELRALYGRLESEIKRLEEFAAAL
jgi:histidine phosphotransfer protein HptB